MKSEIQESRRNSYPIGQAETSWRAQSPAYLPTPIAPIISPGQPLQPWAIPVRSSSSPRGMSGDEAPTQERRRPNQRASLEWNVLKTGMTARARQKEDFDQQDPSVDSNATRAPALRMGLPIEDATRLDIHRIGSISSSITLYRDSKKIGRWLTFANSFRRRRNSTFSVAVRLRM